MSVNMTPGGTRGQRRPPGALMKVISPLTRLGYRMGGKRMDGMPVVLLTTKGARSGELRTSPVMAFPQGDSEWLVVASFGGSVQHPAWFHNMARHPDEVWVELDGRRVKVAPTSLTDEERARAWREITGKAGRFAGYQDKTDREIPVVRLTATGG